MPADLNKNPLGFGPSVLVWHQNEQEVKCEIFAFISCSKRKHEPHIICICLKNTNEIFHRVSLSAFWLTRNQSQQMKSKFQGKKQRGDCALFLTLGDSGRVVNFICKLGFMLGYMVYVLSHYAQIFGQMLFRCLNDSSVQMRLMFNTVDPSIKQSRSNMMDLTQSKQGFC